MTPTPPQPLPVYQVAGPLVDALATRGAVVLTAPTGSGKTTQVPQILRRAGILGDGQILVLQPRRLAARLVAARVAAQLGTALGDLVGFQTRHERALSDATRILFLTEGLFLRRLLGDPTLRGVGAVILDEFHERSLAADLSLGLCRQLRAEARPDLRLLVMSATLDTAAIGAYLDCGVVSASGRTFPVGIEYEPGESGAPVWDRAAGALRRWLDDGGSGDVLVFMPGAYEIRRTVEACRARLRDGDGPVALLPLHSSLSPREQDLAVAPSPQRKVIVSTNVAQTSITIDGVTCVIDSGLARVHRYDPGRGVNALLVERVSRASAEQRAGRAGRTAPGLCLRLWPRSEAHARPDQDAPEVHRVDLSEAVLQLKALGVAQPATFPWLDPPPAARLEQGTGLLQALGAVDAAGALTPLGTAMADVPAHPRLARMLLEAAQRGVARRGSVWAALIAERDICVRPLPARFRNPPDDGLASDLAVREAALEQARRARFDAQRCADLGLNAAACRLVDRAARQYLDLCRRREGPAPHGAADADEALARSLLLAYGDHLALRRSVDTRACEMEGRRRVVLDADTAVGEAPAVVAVEVREVEASRADGGGVHTVASLATAVAPAWIEELFPERVRRVTELVWDDAELAVVEVDAVRFGSLTLRQVRRAPRDEPAAAQLLVEHVRGGPLRFERWDDAVDSWLARARCVAAWFPERGLLTYDDDDLAIIVSHIVGRATRWGAVRRAPCLDHVRNAMAWPEQRFVEEMAPERLRLPGGHGMKIAYTPGEPPRGRARIQDLYGLAVTPRVAGGRVPILLEILAPNNRPAQVTDDLPGFWEHTYPELKRHLKRRYPKHEWR